MRFKRLTLPLLIVAYRMSRRFGFPIVMPMSVSLYTTYQCNSKCKTCNIWQQNVKDELTLNEIGKILQSIGRTPIWFTITGGESLLRPDIVQIIDDVCRYNRPLFINLATNGLSPKKVTEKIPLILDICRQHNVRLTVNVSIDELFERYDEIRGVQDGFRRMLSSYQILSTLSDNGKNFNLGTNTTISKYNVGRFYDIYNYIKENMGPNSFLAEMASVRKAFFLSTEDISPESNKYLEILSFLRKKQLYRNNKTAKLIQFFRRRYYQYVCRRITMNYYKPCYAGIASAEIISNGNIVTCCAKATLLGNLRDFNYNFPAIWKTVNAAEIRRNIKMEKCACDLSNIFYTNTIINLK